jgi:hypothetical protein
MESVLHGKDQGLRVFGDWGPFDNEGTTRAGIVVPLHWTRPQSEWSTRRLPLRPVPIGFAVNAIVAAIAVEGLFVLWRLRGLGLRRRGLRWGQLVVIAALAVLLNILVAGVLWARWQFASPPLELLSTAAHNVGGNALVLPSHMARWPASVPNDWPRSPKWIGWGGEAPGVRHYQYTTLGVPGAAIMWLSVTWGHGAFDPHQSMNVVQVGWPLPCFQSEERITVVGRTPESDQQIERDGMDWRKPLMPIERTSGQLNWVLPGGPPPAHAGSPLPYLPVRPLWLSLGVNMTLYLWIAAIVVLGPGAVRTIVRMRRGWCLCCGYQVREWTVCPECGRGDHTTDSGRFDTASP